MPLWPTHALFRGRQQDYKARVLPDEWGRFDVRYVNLLHWFGYVIDGERYAAFQSAERLSRRHLRWVVIVYATDRSREVATLSHHPVETNCLQDCWSLLSSILSCLIWPNFKKSSVINSYQIRWSTCMNTVKHTSGDTLCVPYLSSQYIVLILYSCCILSTWTGYSGLL